MIRHVQKLFKKKRKRQSANNKSQKPLSGETLQKHFKQNVDLFRSIYTDCADVVFREFHFFGDVTGMLIYIDGLSDTMLLDECVLYPLMRKEISESQRQNLIIDLIEDTITVSQINKVTSIADCIESISNGMPILLIEGLETAISLGLIKFETRGIEEPQAEKVIRGPRAGFVESLQVNTSLLRRIIKSPAMKIKAMILGNYSRTNLILIYIEGIVSPALITEMENRLAKIDIDGVLDSEYIEELIEDNPYSPFPQILSTERPDVVSSYLLEGRAAILVDGSPFALIAPVSLFSLLQAPDDYYERYIVGTIIRWLRYGFMILSFVLPALYVAITTIHQEMIPDQLLLSVAAARESVPFPALVEVVIMELMMEALREAGVRLPNQIGAAVSIVGGLVIGQAAVQAGFVSAPMVIIVATTGVASFLFPRYIIGYTFRFLRFPLIILASFLGLLGIMLGILAIVIHLSSLRSFGEPYLAPLAPLKKRELKDVLWKAPLWKMNTRPHFNEEVNVNRQAPDQKPGPPR